MISLGYGRTGKVIEGNFINNAHFSGAKIDRPTGDRAEIVIDGKIVDRAIYERIIWKNSEDCKCIATFVIVNGVNYEIALAKPRAITGCEVNAAYHIYKNSDNEDNNLYARAIHALFDANDRAWYRFVDLCESLACALLLESTVGYGDRDEDNIDNAVIMIDCAINNYIDDIDFAIYAKYNVHNFGKIEKLAKAVTRIAFAL